MTSIPGIPSLPTDNLYKFIAIFGLVIMTICFSVPIVYMQDLAKNKVELTMNSLSAKLKMQRYGAEIDTFRSQIKAMQEDPTLFTFDSVTGVIYANGNLMIMIDTMQKQMDAVGEKFSESSKKYTNEKALLDYISISESQVIDLCNAGILLGLFMTVFGFILWYINNQIYLDIILKKESEYPIPNVMKLAKKKRIAGIGVIVGVVILFLLMYNHVQFYAPRTVDIRMGLDVANLDSVNKRIDEFDKSARWDSTQLFR